MKNPLFYLLAGAALLLCFSLDREMWFDEVLTLTNFASLDGAAEIYRRYTIPNNHIVYTVFLHYWWQIFPGLSDGGLRLLSVAAALGTITLLWFNFRKESGEFPLSLALAAWIISPAFALYGTAVRGYMLCSFFIAAALTGGKAFLTGKWYGAAVWFLFSLLAVGTMPSALAAVAGAGILLSPVNKWKTQWKKIVLLALLALAAFALFYLPILPQLLRCAALGEGSLNRTGAFWATVTGIFSAFGMLMMTADRRRKWLTWRDLAWLVWMIPVVAVMVLPKAPFPRIFFPLFPLFALSVARTLKRHSRKTLIALLITVIAWGGIQRVPAVSDFLSSLCARAGQDDFISPRFMRREFTPSQSADFIMQGQYQRVFVSFDADPWALLWALSRRNALPPEYLFDGPRGRVTEIPDRTPIVMTPGERANLEKRFNVKLTQVVKTPLHSINLAEKAPHL